MRTRVIAVALLVIIAVSTMMPTTHAQEGIQVIVAYDNVNVRAAPDANAPLLGQLHFESTVTAHSREDLPDNGGIWVYISGEGLQGWVLSTYLAFPTGVFAERLPVTNDLVVQPNHAFEFQGSIKATVISIASLNVRVAPGNRTTILDRLPNGTVVTVFYRNAEEVDTNIWVFIRFGRLEGWVYAQYLEFVTEFNLSDLPVFDATQPISSLPQATQIDIPATVNTFELNVRREPGIGAEVLGKLTQGNPVIAHYREDIGNTSYGIDAGAATNATSDRNVWVYITANALIGWVNAHFLDFPPDFELDQLSVGYGPNIAHDAIVAQIPSRYSVPIRANPGYNAVVIGYAPPSALLVVNAQEDIRIIRSIWVNATWVNGGQTGWFEFESLQFPIGVLRPLSGRRYGSGIWELGTAVVLQQPDFLLPEPLMGQGFVIATCPSCNLTGFDLGVHIEPSDASPVITYMVYGDATRAIVAVHGRTESGDWFYISEVYGAFSGWVKARYINTPLNQMTIPVLAPIANPDLPPAREPLFEIPASIKRPLAIPVGETTEVLPAGTLVMVLGRDLYNRSFKISVNGQEGWLYREELNIDGDISRLPILSRYGIVWLKWWAW